jgi:hypothetical protein
MKSQWRWGGLFFALQFCFLFAIQIALTRRHRGLLFWILENVRVARGWVVVGAVRLPRAADAAPPSQKGAGGRAVLFSSFVFRPLPFALFPRPSTLVPLLSALICLLPLAHAQDLALSEVKPGLEGYSVTAGAGNKLERFDVRVLDTVDDPRGFPLILVRGSGAFLDAVGGIGQGFSGSPVYIGGKLLGAISGGFPNADHRLALVTPISAMRRAQAPNSALELVLPLRQPKPCLVGYGCAQDFALPLVGSGLTPNAAQMLVSSLEAKGFRVALQQNSSAASTQPRPYKLEPGAAIAAQLTTGDVALGAIGTITAIEQNRILAFGHPVLGDLRARYIAMPAYISTIVPSSVVPYKVGSPIAATPLGTFQTDHPAGMAGTLGASNSLPLEVVIKTPNQNRRMQIALAPVGDIYASLLLASVASGIEQTLAGNSPGLARLSIKLEFADRNPITLQEVVTSENVASAAAVRAALMTALISENPYREPRLSKISLEVELSQYSSLRLIKLEPEKKTVKAGELAFLNLRLQSYRSSVLVKRIAYKAPTELGKHRLRVRGAATPRPLNQLQNPDPWDGILTLDTLLERLKTRLKDSDVLVETLSDDPDVIGLERFDVPVTGWAYFDITVDK